MQSRILQGSIRPHTGNSFDRKKNNVRSIAELSSNDSGKAVSGAELLKDLENKVRKVVDSKRSEYDKLQFQLVKLKEEQRKAQLILNDLKQNSEALGLNKYPESSDRLQPIESFSRRPLYSKHTNIQSLESSLALKAKEMQQVVRKCLSYEHMRKRLEGEVSDNKVINNKLRYQVEEAAIKAEEVERAEIVALEAVGHEQTKLAESKLRIDREREMWERELSYHRQWAKEKNKFANYCQQKLRDLDDPNNNNDIFDNQKKSRVVSRMANRFVMQKSSKAMERSKIEEEKYEQAFRKIGALELTKTPEELENICRSHASLQQEFAFKKQEEQRMIAKIQDKMNQVRQKILEKNSKTNIEKHEEVKVVVEDLKKAQEELKHAQHEFEFVDNQVKPVKSGIQQIVNMVQNRRIDTTSLAEIGQSLEYVERELVRNLTIFKNSKNNDEPTFSMSVDYGSVNDVVVVPPGAVSKYNVRIGSLQNDASSPTKSPPKSSMSLLTSSLQASRGFSASSGEDPSSEHVMDRTTVKQISTSVVASKTPKKRKSSQHHMKYA